MRETIVKEDEPLTKHELAVEAQVASTLNTHRTMGVGAACSFMVDYHDSNKQFVGYTGSNINISGMQSKVHAEQFALHQAMMDLADVRECSNIVLNKMVVVTDAESADLVCGHCLQVTRSVCDFFECDANGVEYIAATEKNDSDDFEFFRYSLGSILGKTYAER